MPLCELIFYLQYVRVYKLGATHSRGLVELWFKQDGDVLRVGGLLEGQAGLGLSQLRRLHSRVAVQGRP